MFVKTSGRVFWFRIKKTLDTPAKIMFIVGKTTSAKGHTMPYIKLLIALAGLSFLVACGGSATPKTDDTGEPAVSCDTNPYGEDCGTEFQTQRLNIVSECRTDNTGDFCNDAITFFCDETTIRDLLCRETTAYKDLIAMEQNECLTRTGSQPACDEEERVKNCEASAFSTNCADTKYVMQRETMCLADTTINPACTGTTGIATVFCKDDPFNTATACMADTYLPARITNCITAGNANSNNNCNTLFTASASNTCLTNPFTDACTSNTDFGTYANTARTNRVSFCGMTGNAGNTLCSAGSGYANCVANPFATECGTYFQFAEESYCATNDVTDCPNVTSADWLAGFDAPLNTAGDYTREVLHEFLQGTAEGLDFGNVQRTTSDPTVRTLNLELLEGEAKNGVAWFHGLSGATGLVLPYRYYSGILSGTNLGAPLTSADASVSVPWAGKIGASYLSSDRSDGTGLNKSDFELTVDFANNEIRAFVKRVSAFSDTDHFLLKAEFDDKGRFNGTIIHATFAGGVEAGAQTKVTNGVLTGLIGKLGAVGAFYGGADDTDDSQGNFSGGFVAVPPNPCVKAGNCMANHAAWLGSFGASPPPATVAEAIADTDIPSHFLSVGADGVIDRAGLGRATPATTLSRTGDAMDGVTYVSGSVENVTQSFVGLLPNTNLGAPLIEAPMDTTWEGRYYLLLNNATHPITFNVTFGAGDQAGTITTDPDIRGTYTTTFTLSFTAEGVITGNVLLGSVLTDDTAQARGLIGEQGLVGVFANTDGGVWGGSLHGGFVADNPDYTAPMNGN